MWLFYSATFVISITLWRKKGLRLYICWTNSFGFSIIFVSKTECRKSKQWGTPTWLQRAYSHARQPCLRTQLDSTRWCGWSVWPSECRSRSKTGNTAMENRFKLRLESTWAGSLLEWSGCTSLSFRLSEIQSTTRPEWQARAKMTQSPYLNRRLPRWNN